MSTLCSLLETEQNHPELLGLALDTLTSVISEPDDNDVTGGDDDVDELGEKFAEILIKNKKQV
jgi:hypothetical protein